VIFEHIWRASSNFKYPLYISPSISFSVGYKNNFSAKSIISGGTWQRISVRRWYLSLYCRDWRAIANNFLSRRSQSFIWSNAALKYFWFTMMKLSLKIAYPSAITNRWDIFEDLIYIFASVGEVQDYSTTPNCFNDSRRREEFSYFSVISCESTYSTVFVWSAWWWVSTWNFIAILSQVSK
jgi:hypothetical protein